LIDRKFLLVALSREANGRQRACKEVVGGLEDSYEWMVDLLNLRQFAWTRPRESGAFAQCHNFGDLVGLLRKNDRVVIPTGKDGLCDGWCFFSNAWLNGCLRDVQLLWRDLHLASGFQNKFDMPVMKPGLLISWHIRNGDDAYLNTSYTVGLYNNLKSIIPLEEANHHVFSQYDVCNEGCDLTFCSMKSFMPASTVFHSGESVEKTVFWWTRSQVLVSVGSSMTELAAYLSDTNQMYFAPKRMDQHIHVSSNKILVSDLGEFDVKLVRVRYQELLFLRK
jgi:hypothetical protein